MEVSNEIKEAVAESTEAVVEKDGSVESTTKANKPFQKEKKAFINLEGTLETLRQQLGADENSELVIELTEEGDKEYTNIYCSKDNLNPSALGQRIAWHYTKFCGKNANFYNLSKLVEAGVKVIVNGNELNTDTSKKKFVVYHPAYNQLEMYVMGRLALDMLGKRVPNLRGVKKVGIIKLHTEN